MAGSAGVCACCRYRVCVHERDFTVGQEITENIITAVERSRKVRHYKPVHCALFNANAGALRCVCEAVKKTEYFMCVCCRW